MQLFSQLSKFTSNNGILFKGNQKNCYSFFYIKVIKITNLWSIHQQNQSPTVWGCSRHLETLVVFPFQQLFTTRGSVSIVGRRVETRKANYEKGLQILHGNYIFAFLAISQKKSGNPYGEYGRYFKIFSDILVRIVSK